jgi:hypothetical protein
VRLSEWPQHPYLNDELRQWIALHLDALGVADIAIYATAGGREEDERRVLVATEVGLLDTWYAPHGSSARYSLSVRLYPWQAVRGVDLRGETRRLWAHEHETRWQLRMTRPLLDVVSGTPELGYALTQFAAACAVMAEPAGQLADDDAAVASNGAAPERPVRVPVQAQPSVVQAPIPVEPQDEEEPSLDLERRLRLPPRG